MRQSRITTILLYCFFSLLVGSRSSVFAQQPPQANEKEQGIELYRKGAFSSEKSVAPMTRALRPTIHYREAAPYTEAARDAGIRGTVVLMVVFADDAIIKHIMAIQGLSHGLTEAAIAAARKIKFTPAMGDGKPISVTGSLEFTFNL